MQNISETFELKPEHQVIYASKTWLQRHYRSMLKTFLFSLLGLVVLVVLSCVVWVATWHGDAQFKLGQLYEDGSKVTPQNYSKAFSWYAQSAAKGDTPAQLKLAEMYIQGKGIHQDLSAAQSLYRSMADQGNAAAQYHLGQMYLTGLGATQNIELAMSLLEKSATQGNTDAAFELGVIYAKGYGADVDEQNLLNSDGGVVYNTMHEGVSQDYKRAINWFLKAATLGHADAQSALGVLYFEGKGVPSNSFTAYILEAIATARGSVKAPIWRNLVVGTLTQEQIMAAQPFIDHWQVGQPIIFAE